MGLNAVTAAKRPARLSGVFGVAAATVAIALVVGPVDAVLPIGVEAAGLGLLGLGVVASTRERPLAGRAAGVAGGALALAAVPVAVATIGDPGHVLALVPGLLGASVLALALVPVRGTGSRVLVKGGTGLVLLGVLAAALFRVAPVDRALAGVVLTVVAWDAGDNAIGVGEQLGTRATTTRLQLVHLAGTVAVGAVGVVAALVVGGLSLAGFSLEGFVVLLGAVVLLTVSLHG